MNFPWLTPLKKGPYIAKSASDKTENWPYWYVAGPDGRTNYLTNLSGARHPPLTPIFTCKKIAIEIANIWNKRNVI